MKSVPGLSLHEGVEGLEEAQVIGNRAVVQDVDGVDESGRRGVGRLRQPIHIDSLAVFDRGSDVTVAGAVQD